MFGLVRLRPIFRVLDKIPQLSNKINLATPYLFTSIRNNHNGSALKSIKGVVKRFRLTGNGKLKCHHAGKSHLALNKSRSRIKRLAATRNIRGVYMKKMKTLILTGK